MSRQPKILAFAGSTRKESFNNRLVKIAAKSAKASGAQVTIANLNDYPVPLFDQDLEKEKGQPEKAKQFKALMVAHDGFLISSPEYNSSITAVLKNMLDWVSRPVEGESSLIAFKGKVATLMSTSPGGLGGLRGLVHVRSILSNLGVIVLPEQAAIPAAHNAFAEDGSLNDPKDQDKIEALGSGITKVLQKFCS